MRCFLILSAVFVAWLQISSAQEIGKATCSANGEYCQNHWDCCSNTCFSYLYKCIKSSQRPQNQAAPASQAASPALGTPALDIPTRLGVNDNNSVLTIEDLINSLFVPTPSPPPFDIYQFLLNSRFGEGSSTTEATAVSSTEQCLEIGKKCYRDSTCCTNRCHGFFHQCVT